MLRGGLDERRDDALHPHEARALDQHGDLGARLGGDVARERIDAREMIGAGPKAAPASAASAPVVSSRSTPAARANAPTSRWNAGPSTPTSPMSPSTSHLGDGAAPSTSIAARTESGFALYVSSMTAAPLAARIAASRPGTARNASSPLHDRGERDAERERGRRCGERIARRVPSGNVEPDRRIARRRRQRQRRAVRGDRASRMHRRRMVETELDYPDAGPFSRRIAPHVDERIVGVDHRDPAGGQRADQVCVLRGDVADGAHEFLVLALRIVDERDGRLRDRRELRRLAAVVHPELDHGDAVRAAEREQRQRQPDRVVEIAFGREHVRRRRTACAGSTPAFPSPSSCRCCRRRRRPECRTAGASARRARTAPRADRSRRSGCRRARPRDSRRPAPRRRPARRPPARSRDRRNARRQARRRDRRARACACRSPPAQSRTLAPTR